MALLLVGLALALVLVTREARAQVTGRQLSAYEAESLRTAVDVVEGEIDHEAEGKTVEAIEVVPLEVFEERDPVPGFLNWFHGTTRAYVIEREVLMKIGGPFSRRLADETERNLRGFPQLSVVLVAPLKGSAPDRIRLLVVVKDVWSLRLNWEPQFVNGSLTYLQLQPQESNIAGTARTVFGNAILTSQNATLGGGVTLPRIEGSRIAASVAGNAVVRCGGSSSGELEGTSGAFSYGQPLYSTLTKWSWGTNMSWARAVVRRTADSLGAAICSGAEGRTRVYVPTGETFPDEYNAESVAGALNFIRSFGRIYKTNVSFGMEANQTLYSTDLGVSPEAEAAYRATSVPANDQRIGPYAEIASFEANFQRVINVDTLGLQEDFRIGHFASLRLYPSAKSLGSTRDMLGLIATASYHWPIKDGFLHTYARSWVEFSDWDDMPIDLQGHPASDRRHGELRGSFRYVTPSFGFGRLIQGGQFAIRYFNNFRRGYSSLGTSCAGIGVGARRLDGGFVLDECDRLRGYRNGTVAGTNFLVYNLEYRTPPAEIFSVMLGAAAFYDVGDAFEEFEKIDLKSGLGAGLRLGFPQLNYSVFRVDVAMPLNNENTVHQFAPDCYSGLCVPRPRGELTIIANFGQAF